jgi:hypothetical protein
LEAESLEAAVLKVLRECEPARIEKISCRVKISFSLARATLCTAFDHGFATPIRMKKLSLDEYPWKLTEKGRKLVDVCTKDEITQLPAASNLLAALEAGETIGARQ